MKRATGLCLLVCFLTCKGGGQDGSARETVGPEACSPLGQYDTAPASASDSAGSRFARCAPLLPAPRDWSFNHVWEPGPVGSRDFYFVENGPYARGPGDATDP